MTVTAIVGGQWGDEGKGKLIGDLVEKADLVGRGTGGDNAGHTLYKGDMEVKVNYIPSGVVVPHTANVMGKGMVVSTSRFYQEILRLENKYGIDVRGRLFVSDRTFTTLSHYNEIERMFEEAMTVGERKGIGTTRKAIGPSYTLKVARAGITFGDILDDDKLKERSAVVSNVAKLFGLSVPPESIRDQLLSDYEKLEEYITITNTDELVNNYIRDRKEVVLEGAQATLLSIEDGTYPETTSSNSSLNGLCSGLGISSSVADNVLIVFKIYPTRVGNGYMPTLMDEDTNNKIVEKAKEYGTTTGRRRRCGWFDAVAGRYSVRINNADGIVLTRLDIFDGLPEIRICKEYLLPDGSKTTVFPTDGATFEKCKPVYEMMPGWKNTVGIRDYKKLPKEAREYMDRIEELTGRRIVLASNGPKRHEYINMGLF